MLETRIASYQSRFGMPDAQGKELPSMPRLYKDDYPFLRDVDSMALCNAQMHLDKAYRSFFANPKSGFPKYKSKHRSRQTTPFSLFMWPTSEAVSAYQCGVLAGRSDMRQNR